MNHLPPNTSSSSLPVSGLGSLALLRRRRLILGGERIGEVGLLLLLLLQIFGARTGGGFLG